MRLEKSRTTFHVALMSALVVILVSSMGGTASAQSVAVEFDLGIPVGDTADGLDLGWGIEGRAGMGLPIPAITFEIEALFDWYSLPYENFDDSLGIWRLAGGLRIGVPIPFVPEFFGHLGYGKATAEFGTVSVDQGGFTWDVGLAADLLSLSIVSFGIHVAYKVLSPGDENGIKIDDITWIGLGIHAEFGF